MQSQLQLVLLSLLQLLLSRQQVERAHIKGRESLQGDSLEACLALLEDPEPRVRLAVSECMRLLCEQQGVRVWLRARQPILDSIRACWASLHLWSFACLIIDSDVDCQ